MTALPPHAPPAASSWLWARPRAWFSHARLGPIVQRAFDERADEALFQRARDVGYDVRQLDEAVVAWRGLARVSAGRAPLDARRMVERLWERLLPPRERIDENVAATRLVGVLGDAPVALTVDGRCGLAVFAERDPTMLDAMLHAIEATEVAESDELLRWESRGAPDALRGDDVGARGVFDAVTQTSLRVRLRDPDGLAVTLSLRGAMPADVASRLRAVIDALIDAPLGEAIGAAEWLATSRVRIAATRDDVAVSFTVPWRGVEALARVVRGEVRGPRSRSSVSRRFFDPSGGV